MENLENRIMLKKVLFQKNFIEMAEPGAGERQIFYQDIVLAYLRIRDDKTGLFLEPEIADITADMEGELILYDRGHNRWVVQADRTGIKAGALLRELCIHAPYIVAGGQDWFDCSKRRDFEMVGQMVGLMRECGIKYGQL